MIHTMIGRVIGRIDQATAMKNQCLIAAESLQRTRERYRQLDGLDDEIHVHVGRLHEQKTAN